MDDVDRYLSNGLAGLAAAEVNRIMVERDTARAVAVRLEQENAELRARLEAVRALACDVP